MVYIVNSSFDLLILYVRVCVCPMAYRALYSGACTILFGSVNGKAAEDFCNQCCETERGEKIARLFYVFYRAGYKCTQNAELAKTFEHTINRQDLVEQILKSVDNELVNK